MANNSKTNQNGALESVQITAWVSFTISKLHWVSKTKGLFGISTRPDRLFSNRTGPDQNKKSGLPDRTGPDFFHKFEKNRITTRSYKFQF